MPTAPQRRRIYLMRHGAVDYFPEGGSAASPLAVPLSAAGRAQADAAGRLFADSGVRFDMALASGLPRAVETAQRVLAAAGQALPLERDDRLQEIRSGEVRSMAPGQLEAAFTGVFHALPDALEAQRFMGGETIGDLLDRVQPAFDALLARTDWRCLLLVLHGGVNRVLLGAAASGPRGFLGRAEQGPGCINIIDVAAGGGSEGMVLRAVNLTPTQWLQQDETLTTMEKLLAQYLRSGLADQAS